MVNSKSLRVWKGILDIILDEDQSYCFIGRSVNEYVFFVHTDGWYMLGGCIYSVQSFSDSCVINVIYDYDPGIGYQRTETLAPEKGYWILLNDTVDKATINLR